MVFRNYLVLTVLVVLFTSIFFPITAETSAGRDIPVDGSIEQSISRSDDTWTITGTEYVIDTTETWTGNVRISAGGTLIIDNSRISFDTSGGSVIINVSAGGTLNILNNTHFKLINISNSLGYFIISSGDVLISDSLIDFAGYTTPTNSSGCTDPTQACSIYGPGLSLNAGTGVLRNTEISNSTYGLSLKEASLEITECLFKNNFYAVYSYNSPDLDIKDTTIANNYYGLFILSGADIDCTGSTIRDNYFGIFTDSSDFDLYNCSFLTNIESAISAYGSTRLVMNECIVYDGPTGFPGYNIFIESGELEMKDTRSSGGLWGVYVLNGSASLSHCELTDNLITGLYAYRSEVIITNGTYSGSDYGILLENSSGALIGNEIVDNVLGVYSIGTAPLLEYNTIARNSEYAVLSQDTFFDLGVGNVFLDKDGIGNGLGIFRQTVTVYVRVVDQYDNPFSFVDYKVDNTFSKTVLNGSLYVKADVRGGMMVLEAFKIDNNGDTAVPGPYNISLKWGDPEWGGYITKSHTLALDTGGEHRVSMVMPLPDLYVSSDDISIDSVNLNEGEEVDVTVNVHTTGALKPAGTNVSVYINDKFHKTYELDEIQDGQIGSLTFSVLAAPDEKTGKFRVKVTVENHEFEQHYYMDPYNTNNTAVRSFDISAEDSGSDLPTITKFAFMGFAIVVFIIVLVLVLKFVLVARSPPAPEENDPDEKDWRRQGPPRRRPPRMEPPEMVRRL